MSSSRDALARLASLPGDAAEKAYNSLPDGENVARQLDKMGDGFKYSAFQLAKLGAGSRLLGSIPGADAQHTDGGPGPGNGTLPPDGNAENNGSGWSIRDIVLLGVGCFVAGAACCTATSAGIRYCKKRKARGRRESDDFQEVVPQSRHASSEHRSSQEMLIPVGDSDAANGQVGVNLLHDDQDDALHERLLDQHDHDVSPSETVVVVQQQQQPPSPPAPDNPVDVSIGSPPKDVLVPMQQDVMPALRKQQQSDALHGDPFAEREADGSRKVSNASAASSTHAYDAQRRDSHASQHSDCYGLEQLEHSDDARSSKSSSPRSARSRVSG